MAILRPSWRPWLSNGLVAVGVGGMVLLTQVGLRLVQIGYAWLHGWRLPRMDDAGIGWGQERYHALFGGLQTFVERYAWVWFVIAALGMALRLRTVHNHIQIKRRWLGVVAVLFMITLGAWIRLAPLWHTAEAATWTYDYDEGVYVSAARLWLQGNLPYRDVWLAHPPAGIATLTPAIAISSNGVEALVNARRWTVVLDLAAAALIGWIGYQLGGVGVGALSMAVYLLDGSVASNSTHVWLETGLNVWSLLALGCALHGVHRQRWRWLLASGGFAVLALATKFIGVAVLIALVLGFIMQRQWRAIAATLLGSLITGIMLAVVALWFGWNNLIQQTLLTQMLRPPQDISLSEKIHLMFAHPASQLTLMLASLGMIGLLIAWRNINSNWSIVLIWVAVVVQLFASSPSFYLHYLTQLVAPLAVLAGGLGLLWQQSSWRRRAVMLAFALLILPPLVRQQVPLVADTPSTKLVTSAAMLREQTPAEQPILSFESGYNLLADRPFVRAPDGRLMIDYFMQRRSLGVAWDQHWWNDLSRLIKKQSLNPQAGDPLTAMLEQAPAAVFDPYRNPNSVAQRVLLSSRFQQYPLANATLYRRLPQDRDFTLESIRMRGMSVPQRAQAGEALPITIYWQLLEPETRTPSFSLQVLDANAKKWGQLDKPIGSEGAPFWAWQVGAKVYEENLNLPLDPQIPAGTYDVLFVLYDPATGQPWTIKNPDGSTQPAAQVIERITVER